jgi:hypothetical protein
MKLPDEWRGKGEQGGQIERVNQGKEEIDHVW